jgi:hypothetical protein
MVREEPGPLAKRSACINPATESKFIFTFVKDGFVRPREGRTEGKGQGESSFGDGRMTHVKEESKSPWRSLFILRRADYHVDYFARSGKRLIRSSFP